MLSRIKSIEQKLYSELTVAEKYGLLEEMRYIFDNLYKHDRCFYDTFIATLEPGTRDALDDAWKLWDPVPKNTGSWGGASNLTFTLNERCSYYEECKERGFLKCTYDEHGSPDFEAVTWPGSVVDIADLYDDLSVGQLVKRGGSQNSLHEIAQDRMAINLEETLMAWAQEKGRLYDRYDCFYGWRDENDLVPHEDTDCRTMRLVFRPVHKAFTHRGGISNARNIKEHFSLGHQLH